jgi:aminoglycoside phosphotransferase family enzyme/predicted kinase
MAKSADVQHKVFEYLADPSSHGAGPVRRIDTHAAVVFLAGERAYKVKRAVRFPFLDYSTLTKRHAACLAELEVNRAFAPELYRRVIPITQDATGRLNLSGDGKPIEWAVEMRRFDEEKTLDRLAETRGVDDALATKLAHAVADMHERVPPADVAPWLSAVEGFLDQNATAFLRRPELFASDLALKLDKTSRAALEQLRRLLLSRGGMGLVRRGHGDLHLGNIVLLGDRPIPFDAIEFDPLVAAGDVLYELAFLLMDLVERKLNRAANIVLNGYTSQTTKRLEDFDGLAALPFFMSLRAAIRAKVTAARLPNVEARARPAVTAAAQAYFRLAVDLLSPSPPKLVAIGGLSGTGKSSVARELAPTIGPVPGALILRSDVERKHLFDVGEAERLPPEGYRPEVAEKVYRLLTEKAARVVTAGHSVIVDAVFARASERDAVAAAARNAKVEFRGLFLVADLKTRLARVGARSLDASDADAAIVRQQEAYDLGGLDWTTIDATGSLEQTVGHARVAIGR